MSSENRSSRPPLSRERILETAVLVADRDGLDAVTMRRLGAELDVEAMSLYKHIANKEEILDGILEMVIGQIDIPTPAIDWKEAMRLRAVSARGVLREHSWAIGLFEARSSTGSAILNYLNAILANLRSSGFSVENAAHAFWLLDSYVYGHVVQETSLPLDTPSGASATAKSGRDDVMRKDFGHLAEMEEHATDSEYSFDQEFEFGLELILDGLEKVRIGSIDSI